VKAKTYTKKSKYYDMLSNTDRNIIGKNFGEVLSAIWFLDQNRGFNKIMFPLASNEPLIDYLIVNSATGEELKVSAKFEKGAPPSINAIVDILKRMRVTGKKAKAKKAMLAISENSTVDGIMKTANELDTPGNKMLKKIMRIRRPGHVTPAEIEKFMERFQTPEEIEATFAPMYKEMGRAASSNIISKIVRNRQKRNGIAISPMGYNVVDILNKDRDYTDLLNSALRQFTVTQVYLFYRNGGMDFVSKKFSDSKFEFHYNANAGQPSLKKISFKMK
jgi:hypothetical protein